MPRPRPTLFEVRYSGVPNRQNHWRIVGFINGKRTQYWFTSEKAAKAAAADRNAEITAYGTQVALSSADRIRAVNAAERLAPFGKTLDDAVNFYLAHLNQLSSSISVSELCRVVREEFALRLENGSATRRHKQTMDECLKKFEDRFGTDQIKTVSGMQIKDWLSSLALAVKTRNKILGYIRNAYGIAVDKGLLGEPLQVKSFPRGKKQELPPNPLSPDEAKRLLDAAEPSVLPFIAIGMFAGLRTSERDFLDWNDIHLTEQEPYIDLSAKISKTGRRRLVPVQPALKAFLEPFAKPEGRIIPLTVNGLVAYQNAWERSVKKAALWPWSENRLRDSFVSYRYEATGSAETTAKEAGHSVNVMFDRYQKIVTREAAAKYWAISPSPPPLRISPTSSRNDSGMPNTAKKTPAAAAKAPAPAATASAVTKAMLAKVGRAYNKADMPNVSEQKKVEFAEALLAAGIPILNRSSGRIARAIKGEINIEDLKVSRRATA